MSEGVCHQLHIISYHPQVGASTCTVRIPDNEESCDPTVNVPVVRVKLVESTRLLPLQSKMVTVQQDHELKGTVLIEPSDECKLSAELQLGSCLVNLDKEHPVIVPLTNSTGLTQQVDKDSWSGIAYEATPVCASVATQNITTVKNVASVDSKNLTDRQNLLTQFLVTDKDSPLTWHEKDKLLQLLLLNHDAFALAEGERGKQT